MSEAATVSPFRSVDATAARLNLPTAWLKAEAEAGRVPAIRIGRRLVMDLGVVREALIRRSIETCDTRRPEAVAC